MEEKKEDVYFTILQRIQMIDGIIQFCVLCVLSMTILTAIVAFVIKSISGR